VLKGLWFVPVVAIWFVWFKPMTSATSASAPSLGDASLPASSCSCTASVNGKTSSSTQFQEESVPEDYVDTPAKRIKLDFPEDKSSEEQTKSVSTVTPASSQQEDVVPSETPSTEPTAPFNPSPLSADETRKLLWDEAEYDSTAATVTPKRSDYLSWDDYFMAVGFLSAQRSKDPTSPMGACLVDTENRVIGIGYSGFPRGCSDDHLPWAAAANKSSRPWLHTPHPYACHAEVNAILNKCSSDAVGARLYVDHFPCEYTLTAHHPKYLSISNS
jgi:deoxycytidylate deaminase